MLCQFTVKNFRCIRDELTLDMQAASITEHESSLLVEKDGAQFLPVAVLYGPNGGGKSTVFMAISALIHKVMRPIVVALNENANNERGPTLSIEPFLFDSKSITQPTEFEIFFRTDTVEYRYQLHVVKEKIEFESLHRKTIEGGRYSEVFTRKGSTIISMKGALRRYNASGITETLPLLSFLGITHKENPLIKDVINWFENEIVVVNYGHPVVESLIYLPEAKEEKELLLNMLKEIDIDITGFHKNSLSEDEFEIYATHCIEGKSYELELSQESSGTIKLFGVLPRIMDCIQERGTLIMDELDAKLHPALLKHIISLFINPAINKKKSQLLFTSHDLSTMTNEIFRRDEIWFVAKDKHQATHMYSLVEFKNDNGKTTRKDAAYGKQYLEGRYGADPYLKRIINWEEN